MWFKNWIVWQKEEKETVLEKDIKDDSKSFYA